MATGSDESEFAKCNSSEVSEELRRDRKKLNRKESCSGNGKALRYSDVVRCYKRSKGERPVVVNETTD